MGNLVYWLFTDPATEGLNSPTGLPTPMNYLPWLVLVGVLGLLLPIYYKIEGRRKIPTIKNHRVRKYFLDRMSDQLIPWAIAGLVILGFRVALTSSFFAWRIWHVLWIGWLAAIVIYWIYYFIRIYPSHMVGFEKQKELSKFMPGSNRRRTASARH
jgi:hypothetical protein